MEYEKVLLSNQSALAEWLRLKNYIGEIETFNTLPEPFVVESINQME